MAKLSEDEVVTLQVLKEKGETNRAIAERVAAKTRGHSGQQMESNRHKVGVKIRTRLRFLARSR